MKRALVLAFVIVSAGTAIAQTCIVPAPPKPPTPLRLNIELPPDGGTVGCTVSASVSGGAQTGNSYPISNSKCAQAVAIAAQAAANDNGWNDGGAP